MRLGASKNIKAKLELFMKALQKFYYKTLIFFLDRQQQILDIMVNHDLIPEWEYSAKFGVYLQRKSIINRRIRKIGGANA